MSTTEQEQPVVESLDEGELVYRASDPAEMSVREEGDGSPLLTGRMMPYEQWTEVNSPIEGHFMERFAPGALAKTMKEQASRIRVLFEHGLDSLGRQPIATIDAFRDEPDGAYFEASLLRGVPDLIVEGLRRGVYGSSIRYRPVPGKWERVRSPKPSDYNPAGIPEITVREGYMREVSITAFPVYEGATAGVRSLTDEVAARQLLSNPDRLLEIIVAAQKHTEPQHSERETQEAPALERSRSTQPVRDYLKADEGEPEWLL